MSKQASSKRKQAPGAGTPGDTIEYIPVDAAELQTLERHAIGIAKWAARMQGRRLVISDYRPTCAEIERGFVP